MRPLRFFLLALATFAILVLVAPGCGRSSLEPETLDSGTRSQCGPSNCPDGCCDANGTCRTGRDTRACGSIGGRCEDCVADGFAFCDGKRVCGREQANCSVANCGGCCATEDGKSICSSGTEPAACGQRGGQCTDCADDGRSCDRAARTCGAGKCDSSNCTGCCVGDQCLRGGSATACGTGGAKCTTCNPGQTCQSSAGGGGACTGTTRCGPDTCKGCCTGDGRCLAGNDTTACGQSGQACSACPFDQICAPDGSRAARTCQPAHCGPDTCAGCCVGNQCVGAPTAQACGIKGNACTACPNGFTCQGGACVPGGSQCGDCAGCCFGDVCAVGTQNTACGIGAEACQNCTSQGRSCQAGQCQVTTCNADNCRDGCCQGNTCVSGTIANACGVGGGACSDCTATGQACEDHACNAPCNFARCPGGCCDAANKCQPGNTTEACGAAGAACANCAGSFCNGLVIPRVCSNQQTTCPAPYGSCGGGVSLPVIPATQNRCSDADLVALSIACTTGPDSPACFFALATVSNNCSSCLDPFKFPFSQRTGLWACAASLVGDGGCRHSLGCASQCGQTSCNSCLPTSEDACYAIVDRTGGQCGGFFSDAETCARTQLDSGLCSPVGYPSYGEWLRAVGDHFCGNGP